VEELDGSVLMATAEEALVEETLPWWVKVRQRECELSRVRTRVTSRSHGTIVRQRTGESPSKMRAQTPAQKLGLGLGLGYR